MGIVTSTPRESMAVKLPVLVDSGIDDLLDVIIHADDAPRKKPAPDPLIEGCKRLDIRPQDCMYVGDTRTDIQAGKAAGMKTVGVLTGFDDRQSLGMENPDTILGNISELPEIISTL
jgi:phosphoglycolate phosphatase-like HAD superfamily hydrolase